MIFRFSSQSATLAIPNYILVVVDVDVVTDVEVVVVVVATENMYI